MGPENGDVVPVVAQVEVAHLNLLNRHGMVVTLHKDAPGERVFRVPRGPLLPGEDPSAAAVRILAGTVGIEQVLHPPVFLGLRSDAGTHGDVPTLTIGYAFLGKRPSNSSPDSTFLPVDSTDDIRDRVDRPQVVWAAREAVKELLEITTIALQLLDPKLVVFTLAHLRAVYQQVMGSDVVIDTANFRRKVEAARGFVTVVDAPSTTPRRGRPARWYTAGDANLLEPPIRLRPTSRVSSQASSSDSR